MYVRTYPKWQIAVFSQQQLKGNLNKSDTLLKNMVQKQNLGRKVRKKMSTVCLCLLEDMKNKYLNIVHDNSKMRSTCSVVANMLNCNIEVSSNYICAIILHSD